MTEKYLVLFDAHWQVLCGIPLVNIVTLAPVDKTEDGRENWKVFYDLAAIAQSPDDGQEDDSLATLDLRFDSGKLAKALREVIEEVCGQSFGHPPLVPLGKNRIQVPVTKEYLSIKRSGSLLSYQSQLRLPDQCAVCGSEHIIERRHILIDTMLPWSEFEEFLNEFVQDITLNWVGADADQQFKFGIAVPVCAEHDNPSSLWRIEERLLDTQSPDVNLRAKTLVLSFPSSTFVKGICVLNSRLTPWQPKYTTDDLKRALWDLTPRTVRLYTLHWLKWPRMCIGCGQITELTTVTANIDDRTQIEGVPICSRCQQVHRMSQWATTLSCSGGALVFAAVVALMATGTLFSLSMALCLRWLVYAVAGLFFGGIVTFGLIILIPLLGRFTLFDINDVVSREGSAYRFRFEKEDVARQFAALNIGYPTVTKG